MRCFDYGKNTENQRTVCANGVHTVLYYQEVYMLPMALGYIAGIISYVVFGPWVLLWWLIKKVRGWFM